MSDRYGSLATPDERAHIEVIENPVQVARSTYRVWQPIAERSGFKIADVSLTYDEKLCERLYQDAVARLQPSAEAFAKVGRKDLDAILEAVPFYDDGSGLFLSALLNATRLPQLDGVFDYKLLGYRLAPDKMLILRAGSETVHTGVSAEGWLVNRGRAFDLAEYAAGGLQANYGTVKSRFASGASGGIQVNFGTANFIAECVHDGIQVNCGDVRNSMALEANGGLQVNAGTIGDLFGAFTEGGVRVGGAGSTEYHGQFRNRKDAPQAGPLLDQLKRKLRRIGQLKTPEDFRTLERDIFALGRQIEEAVR